MNQDKQSNPLKHLKDNRSKTEVVKSFNLNVRNEKRVMQALRELKGAKQFGDDVWFDQIDPTEDGTINMAGHTDTKPDFWFWFLKSCVTFEIKISNTGGFYENNVYVKCKAVDVMLQQPIIYPNGKVIVSTPHKYAIMPAEAVAKYPITMPKAFGGYKKVYTIPAEHWEWKYWPKKLF